MTKVLTFGVFDYFHIGHLNLLRQCREHGDYLIVGVQNGEYVARFKPAQSMLYTTNERVTMIEALRIVDEVFVYDTLALWMKCSYTILSAMPRWKRQSSMSLPTGRIISASGSMPSRSGAVRTESPSFA